MSKWQSSPGAPLSNDLDDVRLGLLDIELSTPTAELLNHTTAVLLRADDGPPTAVLRVARGLVGAAHLRTQRRVLAELALHQELDEEWRELLPRILAFDERADAAMSVASYLPGLNMAEVLASHPDAVGELTGAALSAIAPLHRRTATLVRVNICFLRRWVVEPLRDLADMCQRLAPRLVPEVERLGVVLRQALIGRRIPVSWTHGDYTPANLRVAGAKGPVTGIVDWGGGQPGRPSLVDEYLMILSASCQVEQADLGSVVAQRLRSGGLADRERDALHAARLRSDAEIGELDTVDAHLDDSVAILLTWLHRIADLWRRRATHPNQHVWWATNVAPVLDTIAAWHGFDAARERARSARRTDGGSLTVTSLVEDAVPDQENHVDG